MERYGIFDKMILSLKLEKNHYNSNNTVINESFLSEKWSSFEKQYDLSVDLSEFVYDMLKHSKRESRFVFDNNESNIKIVDITLILDNGIINPYMRIISVNNEEKRVGIEVYLSPRVILSDKEFIKKSLSHIFSHELMHGNIFIKRMDNNVDNIDDTSDLYYKLLTLRNSCYNYDSVLYRFSYALYATFYQEKSAFVSQFAMQLQKELNGKEFNSKNIINSMKRCESYIIYSDILHDLVPIMENMSDDDLYKLIVIPFDNYEININVGWIRNRIQYIKRESEDALKKIIRNSMWIKEKIYF